MHQLQRSWVRSQHPSAQWNLRGGRWSSAEYCTKKKFKKSPKIPPCWRMLGSNPERLRFKHWQSNATTLGKISSAWAWWMIHLMREERRQTFISFKGLGNEADFLGFLHKSVRHRSHTLQFEPFRFWLRIRGDNRKTTPRLAESGGRQDCL